MNHPIVSRYFDTLEVRYRYRVVTRFFDIGSILLSSAMQLATHENIGPARNFSGFTSRLRSTRQLMCVRADQSDSVSDGQRLIGSGAASSVFIASQ